MKKHGLIWARIGLLACLWFSGVQVLLAQSLTRQFVADVTQTKTLPGFKTPVVSHGKVSFIAGESLVWQIKKPYTYQFSVHHGVASEILPDGEKRAIDAKDNPWLYTLERILEGTLSDDNDILGEYFTLEYLAKGEHTNQQVRLLPRSAAMASALEYIDVRKDQTGRPVDIVIHEASGGRLRIQFTHIATQ